MKTRKTISFAVALTVALTFLGATAAVAQLNFDSMNGTWWVATKLMDKGAVFTMPPDHEATDKAQKWKEKTKEGYLYFPDNSLDVYTFENVVAISADHHEGYDVVYEIRVAIQGGNPVDFVGVVDEFGDDYGMMMVFQITLTEDKKDLGQIKSGKMGTMAGSFFMPLDEGIMFAGNRDYKYKWVPEDKVPDHIKEIAYD